MSDSLAQTYYELMAKKDLASMEKYLHPDVQFKGPLDEFEGKEKVLNATKNFMSIFETLKIRAAFEKENHAMIVYDLDIPLAGGAISGAVLVTVEERVIKKFELFYDGRPFEAKKDEIFSSSQD